MKRLLIGLALLASVGCSSGDSSKPNAARDAKAAVVAGATATISGTADAAKAAVVAGAAQAAKE